MPEKTTIPTHLLAFGALLAAALMQFGVTLLLDVRVSLRKTIGALIVSGLAGGLVTVFCQEYAHLPSFLAGAIGTASGMFPAALFVMAFSRKALEKAGLKPSDLTDMARAMDPQKEEEHGSPT